MDAKTCYAFALGLCAVAFLFFGLTALANVGGAGRPSLMPALDAAVGVVALGAAGLFLMAGRSRGAA